MAAVGPVREVPGDGNTSGRQVRASLLLGLGCDLLLRPDGSEEAKYKGQQGHGDDDENDRCAHRAPRLGQLRASVRSAPPVFRNLHRYFTGGNRWGDDLNRLRSNRGPVRPLGIQARESDTRQPSTAAFRRRHPDLGRTRRAHPQPHQDQRSDRMNNPTPTHPTAPTRYRLTRSPQTAQRRPTFSGRSS